LIPPEPEERDGLPESDEEEEEWPPKEMVELAERLQAEAVQAAASAKRTAAAAERGAASAEVMREASEAAEAEVRRRGDAAVRVAKFWAGARREQMQCAIIWLHGQGESEASWQTKLKGVTLPERAGSCRWIWPRAQLQPCSTRGGVLTPQWFDTPEFPICRVIRGVPDRPRIDEDPKELTRATTRIHAAIEALEAEGLPSDRIALAGFGQGAALVLHAVLRFQRPLAGGAMLSGWMPCKEALRKAAENSTPPEGWESPPEFLWCHGARDGVVEPGLAAESSRVLKEMGARVQFRLFPELSFGVDEEVIRTLETWLVDRLAGPEPGPPAEEGEEGAEFVFYGEEGGRPPGSASGSAAAGSAAGVGSAPGSGAG